ncbi:hypothetical protein QNI19_17270 [Cytophagaceae bacterium DM2B3-1]|uniref:Lipocalin-like domain-containing protein n=1 Tax=Xanthocytophaga flava TaxID=3048013 RepID=A0AAE3QTL6_9BACT|nr:hypothetical protein [Xanthocytophaga flavus]MDJ1473499.1 hypothetical protein [Xanthocytophaga flavus]MDJ1485232.1 hypothetical protein [Xanthocytophaga flavus]MDJ1494692.1 hypothetical protein [Xanthocytophaga flavus]
MFRFAFIILVFFTCAGFTRAQISANQLVGKYWLYLKEANQKTDEFFEIKPGEGQNYVFIWPDQSSCKLVPESASSYRLDCKDEKLQVTFETDGSKIKGFTLHSASSPMYGLKSE